MRNINDLINLADQLSTSLELIANDDRKFSPSIQLELEKYSWELYKLKNNLTEIQGVYGN